MRAFVLGTGRCGTTTFIKACGHLTNFTAGHETRAKLLGDERFAYPDQHIEADNRLSWFLGELGARFPDAYYIHLRRDPEETAASFAARWDSTYRASMIRAFAHGVVMSSKGWPDPMEVCRFYVDTVTSNIEQFMRGRHGETVWLENAEKWFPGLMLKLGAESDLSAATREWRTRHNAREV